MTTKATPLVDPKVMELAEYFLCDYAVTPGEGDSAADATWDLADDIQQTIESWLSAAEKTRLIKVRR